MLRGRYTARFCGDGVIDVTCDWIEGSPHHAFRVQHPADNPFVTLPMSYLQIFTIGDSRGDVWIINSGVLIDDRKFFDGSAAPPVGKAQHNGSRWLVQPIPSRLKRRGWGTQQGAMASFSRIGRSANIPLQFNFSEVENGCVEIKKGEPVVQYIPVTLPEVTMRKERIAKRLEQHQVQFTTGKMGEQLGAVIVSELEMSARRERETKTRLAAEESPTPKPTTVGVPPHSVPAGSTKACPVAQMRARAEARSCAPSCFAACTRARLHTCRSPQHILYSTQSSSNTHRARWLQAGSLPADSKSGALSKAGVLPPPPPPQPTSKRLDAVIGLDDSSVPIVPSVPAALPAHSAGWAAPTAGVETVDSWLTAVKLGRYIDVFKSAGYDELQFIKVGVCLARAVYGMRWCVGCVTPLLPPHAPFAGR